MNENSLEEEIKDILSGKATQRQALARRNMDSRTYHKLVESEIKTVNPELYLLWITKVKDISSEVNHIDFVSLIMTFMKTGIPKAELCREVGVGFSTVRRRLLEFADSEEIDIESGIPLKEIYDISNAYSEGSMTQEQRKVVDGFNLRPIKTKEKIEDKRQKTEEVVAEYDELVASGMKKDEAAKRLGYTHHNTVERLRRDQKATEKEISFREGIKYKVDGKGNKAAIVPKKKEEIFTLEDLL